MPSLLASPPPPSSFSTPVAQSLLRIQWHRCQRPPPRGGTRGRRREPETITIRAAPTPVVPRETGPGQKTKTAAAPVLSRLVQRTQADPEHSGENPVVPQSDLGLLQFCKQCLLICHRHCAGRCRYYFSARFAVYPIVAYICLELSISSDSFNSWRFCTG